MRATWDKTWMDIAITMSKRSKCTNRQVGAVIVDVNNRPISVGYNGPPAKLPITEDTGTCSDFCERSGSSNRTLSYANCVSVHAEANALLFADRSSYINGTIYISNPCCWDCAKLIANSGLSRVVFRESSADSHTEWGDQIDLLESCGISITVIKE